MKKDRLFYLVVLIVFMTSCKSYNKIRYERHINKPLKEAKKDSEKRVQTFYVHTQDTVHELFNVSAGTDGGGIVMHAHLHEKDTMKWHVYQEMKQSPSVYSIQLSDPSSIVHSNQGHLYVDSLYIEPSTKRTLIKESSVTAYETYGTNKRSISKAGKAGGYATLSLISIALAVLLILVLIFGVFALLGLLLW